MNLSDALERQVTGTVDFGDGLVLPVVHIPHVTVCQLKATVALLLTPYADATAVQHAMTAALREAFILRTPNAATVAGTDITLTYSRADAQWEIRGLPENDE
jgi:hypothetical protein